MERAAMTSTTVIVLAALLAVVSLAAGDVCDQAPSMSWNDACVQSCGSSQAWTKLCQDTLSSSSSNAPPTAVATVYALAAARQVRVRYGATVDLLNQMLGAGNLPKEERPVVDLCKERYVAADGLFAAVIDQLAVCDLASVRQEYLDAQAGVSSCRDALSPSYQSLQLYSMVSGDYDMTMVAYELGALVVGK